MATSLEQRLATLHALAAKTQSRIEQRIRQGGDPSWYQQKLDETETEINRIRAELYG